MKKIILFALVSLLLTSCEYTGTTVSDQSGKPFTVHTSFGGSGVLTCQLYEFEYKGHTYVYTTVDRGIAMAHAGHCKCNSKDN